ncbi:MAG TPA: hypothetical protein VH394_07675 [Thermoanaerobaculia bacterium]|nr:hypothetical protein [Thermoanaerobaculia bacterium]
MNGSLHILIRREEPTKHVHASLDAGAYTLPPIDFEPLPPAIKIEPGLIVTHADQQLLSAPIQCQQPDNKPCQVTAVPVSRKLSKDMIIVDVEEQCRLTAVHPFNGGSDPHISGELRLFAGGKELARDTTWCGGCSQAPNAEVVVHFHLQAEDKTNLTANSGYQILAFTRDGTRIDCQAGGHVSLTEVAQ